MTVASILPNHASSRVATGEIPTACEAPPADRTLLFNDRMCTACGDVGDEWQSANACLTGSFCGRWICRGDALRKLRVLNSNLFSSSGASLVSASSAASSKSGATISRALSVRRTRRC